MSDVFTVHRPHYNHPPAGCGFTLVAIRKKSMTLTPSYEKAGKSTLNSQFNGKMGPKVIIHRSEDVNAKPLYAGYMENITVTQRTQF